MLVELDHTSTGTGLTSGDWLLRSQAGGILARQGERPRQILKAAMFVGLFVRKPCAEILPVSVS
jgi:hypothetical protein